jgi:hypothetical protein
MGNEVVKRFEEDRAEATILPEYNEPEWRDKIIGAWNASIEKKKYKSHQNLGQTTLPETSLHMSARRLYIFLSGLVDKLGERKFTVLEVFAGNCKASECLIDCVRPMISKWICTDIADYTRPDLTGVMSFEQLHSVAAVAKHGAEADILVMICPPCAPLPSGGNVSRSTFADYYACYDFIALAQRAAWPKFIVFVGEVGAADGTVGMYRYLLCNDQLSVILRVEINRSVDILGGVCSREMIILEVNRQ